jgi:CheY-like chemotaxis protein
MISNVLELAENLARPAKILVIDDDVDLCAMIAHEFTRMGCDAICVNTGASALAYLEEEAVPDAVLLDIQLPDMLGDDILVALKRLNLHIPVIILTGYPSDAVNALLHTYGVVAVLNKPITDFTSVMARYMRILNIRCTPLQHSA